MIKVLVDHDLEGGMPLFYGVALLPKVGWTYFRLNW